MKIPFLFLLPIIPIIVAASKLIQRRQAKVQEEGAIEHGKLRIHQAAVHEEEAFEHGTSERLLQGGCGVADTINTALKNSTSYIGNALQEAVGGFLRIPLATSGTFQITKSPTCSGNPITVVYAIDALIYDYWVKELSVVAGTEKLDCDKFAGDFHFLIVNGNFGDMVGSADYSASGCNDATGQTFSHDYRDINITGVVKMEGILHSNRAYVSRITSSSVTSISLSAGFLFSHRDDIDNTDFAGAKAPDVFGNSDACFIGSDCRCCYFSGSGTLENTLFDLGVADVLVEKFKAGINTGFPNMELPELDCDGEPIAKRIWSFLGF